ncbi:hypothetical protein AB0K47_12310 [Streptomyces tirandamycinicus]|uniref:hypothetical protein n=1 Tax=Streptomyces tirandamycinicus TaxID=2174846 RepID=UPI0034437FE6
MTKTASPTRRGRSLRLAAAFAVLLGLVAYVVVHYVSGDGAPRCVVRSGDGGDPDRSGADAAEGGGRYELSPEMAANAATISAVGTTRGMPERAVTIALATALQESALRNIRHGDRDSLGLFQQRPSQGWGTPQQILDPVFSAGAFYDHLAEVPGYSRLPLTVAAQRVQRSGFPQAYAKHEPDAALLSAALTGRASASLTCTAAPPTKPGDPAKLRSELTRSFGPGVLPAAGGKGRAGASQSSELTVPVTSAARDSGDADRRGWELAHWAVAQASELGISEVSFAGKVWSAEDAGEGWRTAGPDGAAVRIRLAR